jgi:cytochrome c553
MTDKDMQDMADHYETLRIDNMKDTLWERLNLEELIHH